MPRGQNIKNLKPFKKGEDPRRNLKGRNKKIPELNELLADVLGAETNGKTEAQKILNRLRLKALKGDVRAAEVLLNRAYGLPKQIIDSNVNFKPIVIDWQDPIPANGETAASTPAIEG